MNLGTLLIIVGLILAVIDLFVVDVSTRLGGRSLLAVAVILIGIGVLVGPEVLVNH